ncbi:MAG: cell division protein FtsZ [Deferribacteraceae bacterium]|jgi:cell division protein FtsZ|nr:cell division protein FtsZ [Deferribacteraceae bacterium]
MDFSFEVAPKGAVIKVVGVGGAGGNAVKNMIQAGVCGVEFIVANTDAQVLALHEAPNKIHLGQAITKGLGAGGNPEIGQKSAIEDADLIADSLRGADIVFVTAGMGGGTGTGAAPVIASIAKDLGALTIAVVSTPFTWEGRHRKNYAEAGLKNLKDHVDSYIAVSNARLMEVVDKNATFEDGLKISDDVLRQGVQGISDTINVPGIINLDCADVRSIMESRGRALMGIGSSSGENRDREALEKALKGPLLGDTNIRGAYGILLNITSGKDIKMSEIDNIGTMIHEYAGQDSKVFAGFVNDGRTDGSIKVTVIATGIDQKENPKTVNLEEYIKKESAGEIMDRVKHISKNDKNLRGLDEYNNNNEYEIPTYLRKQVD